ncbi:MarR family winged helix-turn-helix transcriptional regulator [Streptococcus ruminantium]|uniref:MarR family winged helix-turn-helix transcriptional regulator n=1 Tax=Streptococcus ruminantium TaxID=1917441 RepID=UPI0012DC9BF5|nr:MarR family transcriptional regulator [Streptococcus ruminantium]
MNDHTISQQLCYSFYQTNKLFNQFYLKNLKAFELTYTQYLTLLVLWEKAPLTLKELGNELDLASNTLTPLLKRLEEKGYVQRLTPKTDKRQLVLHLTDSGQDLYGKLEESLLSCFRQLDGLTNEKSQQYIHHNNELIQSLKQYLSDN